MTKQERRLNLGLGIFAAMVFAGSILQWSIVAFLVGLIVAIAMIFCLMGLWASMDDEWVAKQRFQKTPIWKYVYDLAILAMLSVPSTNAIAIMYAINFAMALHIKYRYNRVNRIVSSK
jgi:hypothetical protein